MSATLNHEKFSDFLGQCPVFEIPGRCFPVKEVHEDHIGVKDLTTPSYTNKVHTAIQYNFIMLLWHPRYQLVTDPSVIITMSTTVQYAFHQAMTYYVYSVGF